MEVRTITEAVQFSSEKMQKVNLFESPRMFCDIYGLEPGQKQKIHSHEGNDKIYYVVEGEGSFSTRLHKAYRADYGSRFRGEGIVTRQPPRIGPAFQILVPAVDSDGNERAGIKLPEVAVPLASYTGWNLFNATSGPTRELASMTGSFIPFSLSPSARKREYSGWGKSLVPSRMSFMEWKIPATSV